MSTISLKSIEIMLAGASPHYKSFDERLAEMTPAQRNKAIAVHNKVLNAKYVPQDWMAFLKWQREVTTQ